MLRLFNTVTPASIIFLLLYFAGLSVHVFLFPVAGELSNLTLLADLVFNKWTGLDQLPETILQLIALCCIFLQGLLVCFFMSYFKMLKKLSLIPAITYYLLCFLFPDIISFFPLLAVNFLISWLLFLLFSVYNKSKIDATIFNIGLLVTMIVLFYFPAFIFIAFCIYGLLRLRTTNVRELLVFLSAVIVLYFLQAVVLFWFDSVHLFLQQFIPPISPDIISMFQDPVLIVKFIFGIALFLVSFFFLQQKTTGMVVQTRKYFSCLITFGIFAIASAIFAESESVKNIYPAFFPAAIIIAFYLTNLKNREAAEIIHLAILGIVLLFQYINFAA